MTEKKYLDQNGLSHLKSKMDLTYVKKGEAGVTDYNSLTGLPTLDGTEIKGTMTKKGLGIASKEDIPTNNNELTNGAGYQTASDVEDILETKAYQTAEEVEGIVTGKDYQTSTQVESAITEKGYQTADDVEMAITKKGYQTASDVEGIVNAKVASVYKYKGSVASYADLSEKEKTAEEGDVWNTEDTEQNYAWTGSKWDPLGATFNSSEFVKNKDLTELSNDEIDAIFNS